MDVLSGALGVIVGLAPHALHHIGPLVGTALVAGSGGTALFGVLGFLAAIPLLVKVHRRFSSWWAPAIALSLFTATVQWLPGGATSTTATTTPDASADRGRSLRNRWR